MGQNQWYHFGIGAPPILVYVSGVWDVHWGYGILPHGHITWLVDVLFFPPLAFSAGRRKTAAGAQQTTGKNGMTPSKKPLPSVRSGEKASSFIWGILSPKKPGPSIRFGETACLGNPTTSGSFQATPSPPPAARRSQPRAASRPQPAETPRRRDGGRFWRPVTPRGCWSTSRDGRTSWCAAPDGSLGPPAIGALS